MFLQNSPRKGPPIRNHLIRSHNSTPCTRSSTPSAKDRTSKLQTIFKRDSPLIPVTLTLEQVREYESAFRMFDINGDGVISVLEFKTLLHTVGMLFQFKEFLMLPKKICGDTCWFEEEFRPKSKWLQFRFFIIKLLLWMQLTVVRTKLWNYNYLAAFVTEDFRILNSLNLRLMADAHLLKTEIDTWTS